MNILYYIDTFAGAVKKHIGKNGGGLSLLNIPLIPKEQTSI